MSAAEIVYVIDDDPGVRQSVDGLLQSVGLRVVTFETAASFLENRPSEEASCLVLDLQLPGISGLDLQQRLSERTSPPVIFISGRGDIPSTVRAMKAGAMEFLVKPVPGDVLLAAVQAALLKNRLMRERHSELVLLERRYSLLSHREKQVFPLIVSGLLNKQSAAALEIAEVTLQVHRRQIMTKMRATSFAELVRMASRLEISG